MQDLASTLKSFLRPATSVILTLLLIGWIENAATRPVDSKLSPVLSNSNSYEAIRNVSRHAQENSNGDTSSRLIPRVNKDEDHLKICCLHANILDFYLRNILPHNKHLNMGHVRSDLRRVSEDLAAQGCNVTHYQDHQHAVQFRTKLAAMGQEKGIKKAVGEINILFSYLQDYCVVPKNKTAAF